MNKQEKLICFVLGLALVWCFMSGPGRKVEQQAASEDAAAVTNVTETAQAPVEAAKPAVAEPPQTVVETVKTPAVPEETVVLENDELKLELSSWGAVVKSATLKKFAVAKGEVSETNPAVTFDYAEAPLGALTGVANADRSAAYAVTAKSPTNVTFTAGGVVRTYTLGANYALKLDETFAEGSRPAGANGLGLGAMVRGPGANDIISVDHANVGPKGAGDFVVFHHDDDDTALKPMLGGMATGGCSCGGAASVTPDMPEIATVKEERGPLAWVALKDRFFVTACVKTSQPSLGFSAAVRRDVAASAYRPVGVSAAASFMGGVESRSTEFFIGPKQQSLLWDLGMKDVMEFGMWRWICYPVVWLLDVCYAAIPNYGIAIILLTILVRLVFWPLTRKSTEGMKKMQEIQPLMKELQAKFKDNPQRLQQETFALYREKKVNPLSSCLPMLIQIPVFIALFNVLRAAVELRYAGFLWIADLSEPEHLFASWFPFGGLNILPILMALTMYFQSKLTPSAGDPNQQKMMTIFMPIMMLFMFYNFASALSLYWTLSQVMSIVQMWMIRRQAERKRLVLEPEVIDPPSPTRQQRRHT